MSNPIQQAIEAIEQARTELEQYEEDATGEHYNSPRLNAALSALQSLQGVELPPLPTPWDFAYVWNTPGGQHRSFSANHYNGAPCTSQAVLFTNDQMHAYARTAVAAAMARGAVPQEVARLICQEVAELPDRNSPEDWPEAMLVTSDELRSIVLSVLSAAPTPEKRHELQTNDE